MVVNGTLKLLALKVLSTESNNGSGILQKIEEETGWRASPGSFYPLMQVLVEVGLVDFKQESNIKIYSITTKGKNFLEDTSKKKQEITDKIKESFALLKVIGEAPDKDFINEIDSCDLSFLAIHDSVRKIKKSLSSVNMKKYNAEVNEILTEAAKKIGELK